ncbi:MAG: hypothetical protein JM58_15125 [Peptococcaceae bacterium BICA1-8]|nr:MAG: hypothetical protein JM58_15125 [Peptococcaceae bacterium BICA1-8]
MKLYKMIKKPPFFLRVSNWFSKQDHPIKSGPNSRSAVIIPFLIMHYGSLAAKLKTFGPLRN